MSLKVTFEQTDFLSSHTISDIPYTLYVKERYLLLIPRQFARVHPKFPPTRDPLPRITIHLTDNVINDHKAKYGQQEPFFSPGKVHFGLDSGQVVVAAMLPHSGAIPHWEFRTLMNGDNKHFSYISSDPEATFGQMQQDLAQAAGPSRS